MTDHKALSFDTLTRLAIEAGLMEPRDTMSNLPAEYAGSICIFAELVAAEVREKDAVKMAELEAQLASIGAGGVSGSLLGQPQLMPDLTALTERGAKAWTGVDAQALREGVAQSQAVPAVEDVAKELDIAREALQWYLRRFDHLQRVRHRMRDPERTMVCDILANGSLLCPEGNRYALAAAPQPEAAVDERAAFEQWVEDYALKLEPNWSAATEADCFAAWQARAALAAQGFV